MDRTKLRHILFLGENSEVEFKTNIIAPDILGRVVCGMLNNAGGCVVCGVSDTGQIRGVNINEKGIAKLERTLRNELFPKNLVSFEIQSLEGKALLVVEVPAGHDVPYAYRNVVYIREHDRTVRMGIEAIHDMLRKKQVEPERWERRFSFADPELDLDNNEIDSIVMEVGQTKRVLFKNPEDIQQVLTELSVLKYGRLTNAGDVLFTKNPENRIPQVRVRAACYNSTKADDSFRNMKSFSGPLLAVLEKTYEFIVGNTPTRIKFLKSGLKRVEQPVYPAKAVREALVNAFAHRDYANASGGVIVDISPSRLEIWNSGGFPDGITIETLSQGHISVLRNPDIAHVIYLRGMMEKLGRGCILIREECHNIGLCKPEWKADATGVTLTFFTEQATEQATEQVTEQVVKLVGIMDGDMTRQEMQERLGLRQREHFRAAYLSPALHFGAIEMTEPDKPRSSRQRYRLTSFGKKVQRDIGVV